MEWLSNLIRSFAKPLKWWVVIAPWEQGIRVRLGKTAKRLDPGPHFRIPFLDRVYVQSVRLRTITTSNLTISSRDRKTLTVSFAIHFAICDVVALYNACATPEATLRMMVAARISEHVHAHGADSVSPENVENAVRADLPSLSDWGLSKVSCAITGFAWVRTYRLLQTEYETGAGIWSIDDKDNTGER